MCPSKSEDDYQSASKKSFHLRKLTFGRVDFNFDYDNTAENCLLEVWKLFDRSGKRITELQFLKNLLSSKNLAGLVAIDFANPADKYLPMSGNYPFQFCSNIGHFLSKMKNLWKVPLDK